MSAAEALTDNPRAQMLEAARQFKANWVEFGERLARVLNEKLYAEWGFDSFDKYVTVELHLKRETAYKLVRSYTFVRTAKPEYLASDKPPPPMEVVDFIQRKREKEALPEARLDAFTEQAFENNWTPRTISQKWRDLVSDERTEVVEDKSTKAIRRARELAERLTKALTEIPGIDPSALDAVQKILDQLP